MAFWSSKQDNEYQKMDEVIKEQPGIRQAQLARELEVSPSTVSRRLPSMNEAGYLYWEDEKGGLWPFKR